MSAPMNLAQAADLIDLSIQKIFPKISEPPMEYPKYFNTRKTEDYYEKDSSLSGLGEADFVDENGVLLSDVPVQGSFYVALSKLFLIKANTHLVGNALEA